MGAPDYAAPLGLIMNSHACVESTTIHAARSLCLDCVCWEAVMGGKDHPDHAAPLDLKHEYT